jgi:hypothetical protein
MPVAKGSGSLALAYLGLMDALKEHRAGGTAPAGPLDHKQAPDELFSRGGKVVGNDQLADGTGVARQGDDLVEGHCRVNRCIYSAMLYQADISALAVP